MNKETVLSALLDFYSDKASAHASFLVAIMISLFAIPTLVDRADMFWLSLFHIFVWAIGLWTLFNFSYFAEHSATTQWFLSTPKSLQEKNHILISIKKPVDIQISIYAEKKWNKSLLRYLFLLLKKSSLTKMKLELGKRDFPLKLSILFPFVYFLLGFSMNRIFFQKEILVLILWIVVLIVFFLDLISLISARAK
ncbi:MAG: hypothetical protein ACFFCW_41990 [Candidatus Hodarchaeota archaeon]